MIEFQTDNCERSEAIFHPPDRDCFVAALLAMTCSAIGQRQRFGHLCFELWICLGFRNSDFGFIP